MFKVFLEQIGCFIALDKQDMRRVPYTIHTMVGVVVHSFLSYRGNNSFIVDDEYIYYSGEGNLIAPEAQHYHDVMREHMVVELLCGTPESPDVYEELYGSLRLAQFHFTFQEPQETSYYGLIEQIPQEIKDVVQQEERTQLAQRIARHEPNLTQLIRALIAEGEGDYAAKLTQKLKVYGYRGSH